MPRTARKHEEGFWYHIFARGHRKQLIFVDNQDRRTFLRLLGKASFRFELEVHAYCLLGNHFHLVARAPRGNLSQAMHWLCSVYAHAFNERHEFVGSLYQGRFGSSPITSDEQLLEKVKYVTANAVRHNLVSHVGDYQWSSYHGYLTDRPHPPWLNTSLVLALLHGDRQSYRDLVESLRPEPSRVDASIHDIHRVVADIAPSQRHSKSLLVLAAVDLGGHPATDVADHLTDAKPSSVRSTLQRARNRQHEDPEFAKVFSQVEQRLRE